MNANTAERIKAGVKEPVRSAISPATGGARACPMLKIRIINPSAAGAIRAPTESPTAAAMMEGTDQAVRPKRMVDIRYPELDFTRPKMKYEVPWVKNTRAKAYFRPMKSETVPQKGPQKILKIPRSIRYPPAVSTLTRASLIK